MSFDYPKLNPPSAKSQPNSAFLHNSEYLPNSSTLPNNSAIQPNNSTIFPNSAQLPNTLARQQFSSQFTSPPVQMGPTQKFHSNFEKSNTIALTKLMQQQTMRNENPEILSIFLSQAVKTVPQAIVVGMLDHQPMARMVHSGKRVKMGLRCLIAM